MALRTRGVGRIPLAEVHRVESEGDLEVAEDMSFQRREWAFQRVAWLVVAGLLAASLVGVLGGTGLFASAKITTAEGVTFEYDRFARHHADTTFALEVPPSLVRDGKVVVWFGTDYLDGLNIESDPIPEPQSSEIAGDRVIYTFAVADPSQPVRIEFTAEPDAKWARDGVVGLEPGPVIRFSQFVYP